MAKLTKLPHGDVLENTWSSFSGTVLKKKIPTWCTLTSGTDVSIMREHAEDLTALLDHCFSEQPPAPLRVIGSGWSFSSVVEPDQVCLDAGAMTFMHKPTPDQIAPTYAPRTAQNVPVYFQGGRAISLINQRLGKDGLALQTSGAGDGHRIAGCIATGTHGSALKIGALHDTVIALHLMTGPRRAVLVQPATNTPFTPAFAQWLQDKTGLPTENMVDDDAFHAAQVSLGSLGIVFGVVVEATPIYQMEIKRFTDRIDSKKIWHAIRTLDTKELHPERTDDPDHFDVIIEPYPDKIRSAMYGTLMWKKLAPGVPLRDPEPGFVRASSDTLKLITRLTQGLGGPLTAGLALPIIAQKGHEQLMGDYKKLSDTLFPGEVFGPTTLPTLDGASTEIVVDHADAEKTLRTILEIFKRQAAFGRFYLGIIAVRFVPKTTALLGMNQSKMNCFIELPSGRNQDVLNLYKVIWRVLDRDGIKFACHWGQMGGFKKERIQAYYGPKAAAWTAARNKILKNDPIADKVFASRILARAGL